MNQLKIDEWHGLADEMPSDGWWIDGLMDWRTED